MDSPCANFGDFSFSRFGFIMRTHTQRITDTWDTDDCYTDVTTVGVTSNNIHISILPWIVTSEAV